MKTNVQSMHTHIQVMLWITPPLHGTVSPPLQAVDDWTHFYVVLLSSCTMMPVHLLLIACVKELMDNCLVKIINSTQHLLYCLLPPQWEQHYELRQRVHNFQLPTRSSSPLDSNYFMRMLFKNIECALSTASILWYFITALLLRISHGFQCCPVELYHAPHLYWYTNRWLARLHHTSPTTSNSLPTAIAVSCVLPPPGRASSHGPTTTSVTAVSLQQAHACGTGCRCIYDRTRTTHASSANWKLFVN